MQLPNSIAAALAPAWGAPRAVSPVAGGMMNRAARVEFERATLFVKWSQGAPAALYAAEVEGLDALRATATFCVPAVVAHDERFLALEWLEGAPQSADLGRVFAENLVALHRSCAEHRFGWARDNFLGEFSQPNAWSDDWPRFYAEQRLLPHLARARENGVLPAQREALLRRVIERLDELCRGVEARPSLVHGDLWSGNFLALQGGEIALFDSAVCCAPREMELAYIELFGGFAASLVPTYRALWPLPDGYESRRPLWQLYPLLVHLNAFGEEYGAPVEAACRAALRG